MTVSYRTTLAALDRAYRGVGELAAGLTATDLLDFLATLVTRR